MRSGGKQSVGGRGGEGRDGIRLAREEEEEEGESDGRLGERRKKSVAIPSERG